MVTMVRSLFFLLVICETISFSLQRPWVVAATTVPQHSFHRQTSPLVQRGTTTCATLNGFPSRSKRHFPSSSSGSVIPVSHGVESILSVRGGNSAPIVPSLTKVTEWLSQYSNSLRTLIISRSPKMLFDVIFVALLTQALFLKISNRGISSAESNNGEQQSIQKPASVRSLQRRFLLVFWLLRMADWLQGPYFFEVYSSKILSHNQMKVSLDLVSRLFLVGFATTALFGPRIGRMVDQFGGSLGSILYTLLYSLSALSTLSSRLSVLILGRIAGGLGTSLLFSAPESWIVQQHRQIEHGEGERWLGDTFGLAYAGDAIVAIMAGQLATWVASRYGPTGPFMLSSVVLGVAFMLIATTWKSQSSSLSQQSSSSALQSETLNQPKPSIRDALKLIVNDPKIWLLGITQALFEGAMYIFVLQWPPMIKKAIEQYFSGTSSSSGEITTPFGTIFSCLMTSCLLGTTLFSRIRQSNQVKADNQDQHESTKLNDNASDSLKMEKTFARMLYIANMAMGLASYVGTSHELWPSIISFLTFEICVGMYFPMIGMLRSTYFPSSHRSMIQNIFGIPLNLIVVSVFLSIHKLGNQGALACCNLALTLATICMRVFVTKSKKL